MRVKPIYVFETGAETGIDIVPVGTLVMIGNADGNGNPAIVQKIGQGTLIGTSTISAFLADGAVSKNLITEDNLVLTGTSAPGAALNPAYENAFYINTATKTLYWCSDSSSGANTWVKLGGETNVFRQVFSGDGSVVNFTLSTDYVIGKESAVTVVLDKLVMEEGVDYDLSGGDTVGMTESPSVASVLVVKIIL